MCDNERSLGPLPGLCFLTTAPSGALFFALFSPSPFLSRKIVAMTIRPASVTFRLYQGATFSEPVTLKDANNNPIDLSGASAWFQARRDISDPDPPVLDLSSGAGGIILGGVLGTVTLNYSASNTAALSIDWAGEVWYHDLKLLLADGTTQRTYQGAVIAYPAVTRAP